MGITLRGISEAWRTRSRLLHLTRQRGSVKVLSECAGDGTMATPSGIVRFHQQDHTLTFRVEGRGTVTQSLPMRRLAERGIEAGITLLRIDLRECTYMDSTFLGTLLTLKKLVDR